MNVIVTVVLAVLCGVLAVGWFVTVVSLQRDIQWLAMLVEDMCCDSVAPCDAASDDDSE